MVGELELKQAVKILSGAQQVVVFSGSGISRESGIPTFREAQTGLWERYNPEELATPQAFRRNPDFVWSWYMYRHDIISKIEPNPGHYALVELEDLVPELVVITQNIDGLHKRAGSSDIIELHGNIGRFKCFDNCQGNPTIVDLDTIEYDKEHAPACPYCGGTVRPDVVWFTENLPEEALNRAFKLARQCDAMLVIGTSGFVQPAASLPPEAKWTGAKIIEINPEESMITRIADAVLQGPSGETLPRLVEMLRNQQQ